MESDSTASIDTRNTGGAQRLGFWIAIVTAVLTVVTFALALTALPDSVPYPFTDPVIAQQWPGDYLWMYPAMVLMLLFVALLAAIHEYAPPARRVYGLVGLCVAVIAAAVLIVDYYVQATVMQPSLEKGQFDGWAMLTQYNPNGVFIALEEIGYLLMSLALLCVAPVFMQESRLERAIRWLFALSFAAVVLALIVVSALRGIDRGVDFEIIVITVVWLTLIVGSILIALVFRRAMSREAPDVERAGAA
ncbi:MAG: hypothetical protein JW990_16640 [Thermoleophilia bacterium]|nr:hypothetical protein [Thermoleophilia bacterium]